MAVLRRPGPKLRGGLFAVVSLAAMLTIPALASADKVTVHVETQLAGQAKYTGKVKARNDRCRKKRAVQLFDLSQPTPLFLGETQTDEGGNYELIEFAPVTGQQVQIVVPKAKKGKTRCGELQKKASVPAPPS